jgi:5'-nucleotidase (lipoprotein e(P4) family)
MTKLTFLPVALSLFVIACSPAEPAAAESSSSEVNATTTPAAAPMPANLHWFRNSAERQANARQTFRFATMQLEETVGYRINDKPWGVIVDADETVLDNSQFQKESFEQNIAFTPERWTAWVHRKEAKAIPGAGSFLKRVHALGGKVVVVTNRVTIECPDTELNLHSEGLEYDAILCKSDNSDKNPRFDSVARGTATAGLPALDVVMFVGDNILDFPQLDQTAKTDAKLADFGSRFVMMANPMYGSWETNPQN